MCYAAVDHLKREFEHYLTSAHLQEKLPDSFGKIEVKLHCCSGVPITKVHPQPHTLLPHFFCFLCVLNSFTPYFQADQLISVRFHGNQFSLQIQHMSFHIHINTPSFATLSIIRRVNGYEYHINSLIEGRPQAADWEGGLSNATIWRINQRFYSIVNKSTHFPTMNLQFMFVLSGYSRAVDGQAEVI